MTNQKQIEANQKNAQQSTGPKTEEGKATVARNALKHGLLSSIVLMQGEDQVFLQELLLGLHAALNPVGELEIMLVDQIIADAWRLRRAVRFEHEALSSELARLKRLQFLNADVLGKLEEPTLGAVIAQGALENTMRYETHIRRNLFRTLHELQRLQAVRAGQTVQAPIAVDVGVETSGEDT